jgi:outer membrane receptor protein involved in Fe transport
MKQWYRLPGTRGLILCLTALTAFAQSDRGIIAGIVSDPSGGAVSGAVVTVQHAETGVRSNTTSTSTGNYLVPALPIGSYQVEIEAPGFKRLVQQKVTVNSGSTTRLDLTLELGSVTESVQVTAEAPSLQTDSARVATHITGKLVEDLPLVVAGQIRNVMNLAIIAPEAKTGNQFRIGGGQGAGWDMNMDGASVTSASTNYQQERAPLSSVSLDAISEFAVESSGLKAEHGRAMGIINFVTKSGTNEFHGNVFEFMRNEALDARGFFAERRAKLRQHDFGGTIGGPVILPKIYNGRNKTFFFVSYEGFRNREGSPPFFNTVPLPEMYQGDFRGWTNTAGQMIQIYDPATTRPNPSGSGFIRDPFPNNQIPVSRFSEVAKRYLEIRPAELVPNRPGPRLNYFRQEGAFTRPWNKGSGKLDHVLSSKDQLSFLYHKGIWRDLFLNDNPPGLPMPFNGENTWFRQNTSARWSWNRTISSRILNSLRVLYQDENGDITTATAVDPDARWGERVGIKNSPPEDRGLPRIVMTDYATWSGAAWGFDRGYNAHVANDLSIVTGKHSFKTGFFYQYDRWDGGGQHRSNGSFDFSYLATAIPADQSRNTGNAFASFLLGYPGSTGLETTRDVRQVWQHWGGYFQDDWRVTSKLTLNLGLRYEYTRPVTGGAIVNGSVAGFSNFDPTVPNPAAGGIPGALIFSGEGPNQTGRSTMFKGWPWAFGPRLGLAYNLRPGTVIRASGTRSFGAIKTTAGSTHFDGFILNTNWASADQQINDFPTLLDQGLPAWENPPFLNPSVSNNLANIDWWQPHDAGRPPEFWSWSFDIQQQIGQSSVFEIGYRATRGTHLTSSLLNINQIHPRYLQELGPDVLRSNINSAAARNAGIGLPFPGFQGTVQQALQAFPQYREVRTANGGERVGTSSYHTLVMRFDRRYSNGMTLLGSYALSKMFSNAERASQDVRAPLDYYNLGLEKYLSRDDQTHVARVAFSYELPFGRGKPFLSSGILSSIIGNWGLSGFLEYASGTPLGIDPGVCPPIYPSGCGNRVTIESYDNWREPISGEKFDPFVDSWWNPDAFQQRPASELQSVLGNATPTNPKARQPWLLNENISLAKNFVFTERVRAVFRFEAFNIANRVRWGTPNSTYTSPNFGLVRSQANDPRRLQLGFKLQF